MPTIHFLGKIVPSNHLSATMWELPEIQYRLLDLDLQGGVKVRVQGSTVDVKCVMNRYDLDLRRQVRKLAYDLARTAVNLVCFSTGLHLSVFFDSFIDPDGNQTPYVIHDRSLAALCTSYVLGETGTSTALDSVLQFVLADPQVFLALDDLITATGHHHLLTINSARAIEGLRHAMCGFIAEKSQQWTVFRANLNLSKDYLQLITDSSTSGRHGEGKFIPGNVTEEIMKRSWTIMNRFLEFKKRGSLPLPVSEFPLLSP
jgi:hypothetical protein